MSKQLTKKNTKYRLTVRKKKFYKGCIVAGVLVAMPFLFYIYRYAPQDSNVWETSLFTINSGGFYNVEAFTHAIVTKLTLIIITSLWFFTSDRWWRFAILVPFAMFLFQFSGVLNFSIQYIDEYDFWYSLPIVLPIVISMIWISVKLNKDIETIDVKEEIDQELNNLRDL